MMRVGERELVEEVAKDKGYKKNKQVGGID
jgi:hypothetical protein